MQVDEATPMVTMDVRPIEVEVNMQPGTEIFISEEEIMSVGDSKEGEDGSDGLSDRSSS